jgi:ABC-type phosphonate transport system ATPase subunit
MNDGWDDLRGTGRRIADPTPTDELVMAAADWAFWHPAPGDGLRCAVTVARWADERARTEDELRAAVRAILDGP